MRNLALIVVLAALLAGCTQPHERGDITFTWRGEAFGHAYTGHCTPFLLNPINGNTPIGIYEAPDRITITEYHCKREGPALLRVLAHEVAHMVECGRSEECADRVSQEWIDSGVTLADLGWP